MGQKQALEVSEVEWNGKEMAKEKKARLRSEKVKPFEDIWNIFIKSDFGRLQGRGE